MYLLNISVTVELYEYNESMDDDVLSSMGVKGGLIGQLSTDVNIERERKLLQEATSHTVGDTIHEFPRRVLVETRDLVEVDETYLSTIETAAEKLAEDDEGSCSAEKPSPGFVSEREILFSQNVCD